jgi:cytochrome c biogenesis protein CcmG/thiol:disulfide interchange protein DsbE
MPKTRLDWIVITIIALILGGVWIGSTRALPGQATPAARSPAPEIGHPAPDFTLTALDGSEVSLSDFRGQPVVLNFWATWCPPCRAEVPALQSVSESLAGEVVILGVSLQESPSTVSQFADEFGISYPVVLDQSAEAYLMYRVRSIPTTFFIDERGVVTEVFSGPLNEPLLLARLDQ